MEKYMNFKILICVLLALFFLSTVLVSCITFSFKRVNAWTEPKVENISGNLVFNEPAKIGFSLSADGQPLVRAQLYSPAHSKSILVMIDTGAFGSYIDERLLEEFSDAEKTDLEFSTTLGNNTSISGFGYIFTELDMGEVRINAPLFNAIDMTELAMETEKGEKAQCILGMNILKKSPFLISNTTHTIVFQEEVLDESYTEIPLLDDRSKNGWDTNRPMVILPFYGPKYPFLLDTGAYELFFSSKFISKNIDKTNKIVRYKKALFKTIQEGVIKDFYITPEQSVTVPFTEIFGSSNTLGYAVLCSYDIFIDYKKNILKVKPINGHGSYSIYELITRPGSKLTPTFGFSIREYGTRRFIWDLYSDSNKKLYVKGLKFNDELISVNGITLDTFDWNMWYQLTEADFVFRRKGKDFSMHLKRQAMDGF